MTDKISSRRGDIPPFIVMDVMQQANKREMEVGDVIHMEVGQPATPAPDLVKEAAAKALQDQTLGYTDAMGIRPLRERISQYYAEKYQLEISPERILVTTGSSAGFVLAFLACFDAGDKVALPAPGYPCYRHILKSLSIEPVTLVTDQTSRWMPTPGMLTAADDENDLKGLLLASPANPTGTALKPETLTALVETCQKKNIQFISDEIYHGLDYTQKDVSALSCSDDVIVINSFSKYFSMTGWRIGWLVLPPHLIRTAERLMQNLFISAPSLSQFAAIAAMESTDQLEKWKAGYGKNRQFLMKKLPEIGLPLVVPPDGAFYIYLDVEHLTNDSFALCQKILQETGVALTPGNDFDEKRGHHFIRLSYAGKYSDMVEATNRLERFAFSLEQTNPG